MVGVKEVVESRRLGSRCSRVKESRGSGGQRGVGGQGKVVGV